MRRIAVPPLLQGIDTAGHISRLHWAAYVNSVRRVTAVGSGQRVLVQGRRSPSTPWPGPMAPACGVCPWSAQAAHQHCLGNDNWHSNSRHPLAMCSLHQSQPACSVHEANVARLGKCEALKHWLPPQAELMAQSPLHTLYSDPKLFPGEGLPQMESVVLNRPHKMRQTCQNNLN